MMSNVTKWSVFQNPVTYLEDGFVGQSPLYCIMTLLRTYYYMGNMKDQTVGKQFCTMIFAYTVKILKCSLNVSILAHLVRCL